MTVYDLAYLFWHAPSRRADRTDYEAALGRWHAALAAHPPPGFGNSWTWGVAVPPWLGGWPDHVYLDVYLVADWAALGDLNAHAPSGLLRGAHDAAAGRAAFGSGALFASRPGAPASQRAPARERAGGAGRDATLGWYDKPAGTTYPEILDALAGEGRSVWLRQMVLGSGPELLVMGAAREAPPPGAAWTVSARLLPRKLDPTAFPPRR